MACGVEFYPPQWSIALVGHINQTTLDSSPKNPFQRLRHGPAGFPRTYDLHAIEEVQVIAAAPCNKDPSIEANAAADGLFGVRRHERRAEYFQSVLALRNQMRFNARIFRTAACGSSLSTSMRYSARL